jgi:hypothetical protein
MSYQCLNLIVSAYLSKHAEPEGVSSNDVARFEQNEGIELPKCYREYLMFMGNDKAGTLRGSDVFFDNLESNRSVLDDLAKANNFTINSIDQIVFFTHQGYIAGWFKKNTVDDDPECYFFSEGTGEFSTMCFTDFLKRELKITAISN